MHLAEVSKTTNNVNITLAALLAGCQSRLFRVLTGCLRFLFEFDACNVFNCWSQGLKNGFLCPHGRVLFECGRVLCATRTSEAFATKELMVQVCFA